MCLEFRRVLFRSDRKSTRLNSSHTIISYAVFCLEKFRSDRKSTRLNSSHTIISYAVFCLQKEELLGTVTPDPAARLARATLLAAPPAPAARAGGETRAAAQIPLAGVRIVDVFFLYRPDPPTPPPFPPPPLFPF